MKLSIETPPLTPIDYESDRISMRGAYSLPDVKTWQHRPLMVCVNSSASSSLVVPDHGLEACPLGEPFDFSSEMFEGQCLIRLKDSNSDNPEGDEEYFSGRKRIFQSVIQGRFKEEVSVSDVMTGHEFARPLKNLPHSLIVKAASSLAGKIAPGVKICVHDKQPFLEATLGGTSKTLRADKPGSEQDITSREIQEDCTLFGGEFADGGVSISRRRKVFGNPAKCEEYTYNTETVYTFEFYENIFHAQTYSMDLGFTKIECSNVLDGQPVQRLSKMRDGRYLWSFQVWHEKLLANGGGKSILLED